MANFGTHSAPRYVDQFDVPQSFPIVETANGPRIQAFGFLWPLQNDITLHLNSFRLGIKKEDGGWGKTRHLVEAHNLIWPAYVPTMHDWFFQRFKAFCDMDSVVPGGLSKGNPRKIIALAGGSSTGKSDDMARYALLWWWANPTERAVLACSTSLTSLKKRFWSYIADCKIKAERFGLPGYMTMGQQPQILFDRMDQKHGIHGIPLKEGEIKRALRDVIGIHPKEALLVVVDEATDVPPILEEAMTNWDSDGIEFQMILAANSSSKLDPHGRASKPVKGWNSVHPDKDEAWETSQGVCLYFDCYKSPAITAPISYRHKLKFLIGEAKIKREEERLGKDSPQFWRFVRGFWPPEDLTRTVLSLNMVERHKAQEFAEWTGAWKMTLAGLDPAFTSEGDECVLRFADVGPMTNGKIGIDFGGPANIISLHLDARSKEPINYQIIRQARMECEKRGVQPEHFGLDSWGFGSGAGDICEREWSPNIHRVIGIGVASEDFVQSEVGDRAIDVYADRITELWFAMRKFVEAEQVRGLDDVSVEEFCSREYKWKGRKILLESKRDYKKRMGREAAPTGSPDHADAAVIILEVARNIGFRPGERTEVMDEQHDWERRWERGRHATVEVEEDPWSNAEGILDSGMFASEEE